MRASRRQDASASRLSVEAEIGDVADRSSEFIDRFRAFGSIQAAADGDATHAARKLDRAQNAQLGARFRPVDPEHPDEVVLIALWEAVGACAWCSDVVVDSKSTRPARTSKPILSLCPQCQGSGTCSYCNGRAAHTKEMCPCWWWEERGFDEAFMGRCGDCTGSGSIELHERRDVG